MPQEWLGSRDPVRAEYVVFYGKSHLLPLVGEFRRLRRPRPNHAAPTVGVTSNFPSTSAFDPLWTLAAPRAACRWDEDEGHWEERLKKVTKRAKSQEHNPG
jgi:hypothetical protein